MALIYAGSGLTDTDYADGTADAGWQTSVFIYGGHITIPSSGTVTQLGVKCQGNGVTVAFKIGLYNSSGTLLGQSTGSSVNGALQWQNSGAVSIAVSSGTHYVMVSGATNNFWIGYDTTGAGSFASEAYATAMAASETISAEAEPNQLYGVRLDFTASGGGGSVVVRQMMQQHGG